MIHWLRRWIRGRSPGPEHLKRGRHGEEVARDHLCQLGWKLLAANYRGHRGELDLVFRDGDCLVFVEVKARSGDSWTRPAAAVNERKQRLVSATALDYLREVGQPRVKFRFDIVEVVLDGSAVREVRHLINAFPLHRFYQYV